MAGNPKDVIVYTLAKSPFYLWACVAAGVVFVVVPLFFYVLPAISMYSDWFGLNNFWWKVSKVSDIAFTPFNDDYFEMMWPEFQPEYSNHFLIMLHYNTDFEYSVSFMVMVRYLIMVVVFLPLLIFALMPPKMLVFKGVHVACFVLLVLYCPIWYEIGEALLVWVLDRWRG